MVMERSVKPVGLINVWGNIMTKNSWIFKCKTLKATLEAMSRPMLLHSTSSTIIRSTVNTWIF
jgi:hypothetical protein